MGRSAKALPGQKFRTPLSARISVKIPGVGAYDVKLIVNGGIARITTFYIVEQL